MKDVVELNKALVEKLDDDILVTAYKSNTEISEEDAKEIDGAHVTMSQGDDMFVIVDLTSGAKLMKTAEDFLIKKAKMVPYTLAMAMVKESKGLFFRRVKGKRFLFPYKEFKTKEEAKAWIDTLRN
ncbi:MAG: hypothetical protein HUJ25_01670 [Crocinitomicaceae bacterium]|nr:hypothetical protein [Crocinitomicaceae bacterium]